MKHYIDNKLIQKLLTTNDENERKSFFYKCMIAIASHNEHSLHFTLGWSSLLEYLGLGTVFESFQALDEHNKIFCSVIEVLKLDSEKEIVIYLYDQIFVECLTQIKALQQIQMPFLLEKIQKKRNNPLFSINDPFAVALDDYEKRIKENPQDTFHDLILYLAWDRVCVYLAAIFDHPTVFICHGLETLKECLIESFMHITKEGKTSPGFFRLVEALYAYDMKEENLQHYTETEWQILCEGSKGLKPRELLPDSCYIDSAITNSKISAQTALIAFCMESSDKIKAMLALSDYMLSKLKNQIPDWPSAFRAREIVCLKENENRPVVDCVICR